jgi:lysophospholipid acyltransferase (LPLAT)-like uncharacterized protein
MAYIKNRLDPWKLKMIGFGTAGAIGVLGLTWRVRYIGRDYIDRLTREKHPFVLIFWHGDMLMGWYFHRNRGYSSLVSMSRDGDLLAEILRRWKYRVIRGSSSRGGQEARAQMESLVREGHVLVVTPDGPRGPRYEMKMGALRTAQKTGVPVVSVSFEVTGSYRTDSWDRFIVPAPFSKILVKYHSPEIIDPGLSGEELDKYRSDFQKRMQPGLSGA